MENYKLYLFLKKIENYESGLINKIKYFFEYETQFMLEFNKFIFHKSDFSSYYYIKSCYTYKDLILHIHFNTTYNHYHSNFNINIYYDNNEKSNYIICKLNFNKIINIIITYLKQNRNYVFKLDDLKKMKMKKVFDIILDRHNIYIK